MQFDESQHDIAPEQSIAPKMEERLTMLRQVMVKCLPLDRALLLLYLDDRSYREIAAVLRLTETNVATKLSRLKERLGRFRSGLRPLVFGQTLQLIVGAVIIIIAADFWVRHVNQLHLLLSGCSYKPMASCLSRPRCVTSC